MVTKVFFGFAQQIMNQTLYKHKNLFKFLNYPLFTKFDINISYFILLLYRETIWNFKQIWNILC